MLPILAGILVSGLTRSGSGKAASPAQPGPPTERGGLGDILGQIFGRGLPSSGSSPGNARGQPIPVPTDTDGQGGPGGDLLGQILREFEKGIREGRIKPVIIGGGPVQIPMPGGQAGPSPSGPNPPQMPGGDVLGQILRDIFGGATGAPAQIPQGRQGQSPQLKDLSEMSRQLGVMSGVGTAVFGDRFEVGRDIEQGHVDDIQGLFDRYFGAQRR